MWQINLSSMSQQDQFIAYNIIDYINDDGFLTETIEDLFILLKRNLETTFKRYLQFFIKFNILDPIGVGATSLKDCLLIQLEHFHKDHDNYNSAKHMIEKLEDDIKPTMLSFDAFISEFERENNATRYCKIS
jgi:RNA polymerase sigma-54 factor